MRRPNRTEVLWLVRHYWDEYAPIVEGVACLVLLIAVWFGLAWWWSSPSPWVVPK